MKRSLIIELTVNAVLSLIAIVFLLWFTSLLFSGIWQLVLSVVIGIFWLIANVYMTRQIIMGKDIVLPSEILRKQINGK